MAQNVRPYSTREQLVTDDEVKGKDIVGLVLPSDAIASEETFMRGHHTYTVDSGIVASVVGIKERVNKLICVNPLNSKYSGDIGDVVIGRVTRIENRRWYLDINARREAVLLLSSINLPGGELRRKNLEDELQMKVFMNKGDLVVAEVQHINSDGTLSLHTRSIRYGKLPPGVMTKVQICRIKRLKTQIHLLPCGINVIFGANGYIWFGSHNIQNMDLSQVDSDIFWRSISSDDRQSIAILKQCTETLDFYGLPLYATSLVNAFDSAQNFSIQELKNIDVQKEIAEDVKLKLLETI